MRYIMKHKLFSLPGKFAIQDEKGEDAFFVRGQAFSLGRKLFFEDPQGNELLFIHQKLLSVRPTYELFRGGKHLATMKQEVFAFHATFDIHVDDLGDLRAKGNLSGHEYAITRSSQTIAQISKQWFSWADTYGVEVTAGEDPVLILASAVIIDACGHE